MNLNNVFNFLQALNCQSNNFLYSRINDSLFGKTIFIIIYMLVFLTMCNTVSKNNTTEILCMYYGFFDKKTDIKIP